MADSLTLLSRVPLFAGLPREALAELLPLVEVVRVARGQVLVREGAPNDRLWVLADGQATVSRGVRGEMESVLAELGPGDTFGELALVDDAPADATVTADEPATLLRLDRAAFATLLQAERDRGAAAWSILRGLAAKMREANERLKEAVAWSLDATALDPAG